MKPSTPDAHPASNLKRWLLVGLCLLLAGCSGVSAINIPGLGYYDFDPPPVTQADKAMMYDALVDAAERQTPGVVAGWFNPETGSSGRYEVVRLMTRRFSANTGNPLDSIYLPAAELNEFIHAGGREFKTLGMNVYREANGRWYRYR